ncbi:hypothetical protein J6590_090387 [Homalodisca vitripennis]|nr:hypothetical protein J6590_090387 [Homalodisca vitripennis]
MGGVVGAYQSAGRDNFSGAGGLRDVTLRMPVAVPTGSTASLLCLYDLEGDQLYTVKWYKGRQEFFRYVLKELPHTRVFALPGINVDIDRQALTSQGRYHNWGATAKHVICPCVAPLGFGVVVIIALGLSVICGPVNWRLLYLCSFSLHHLKYPLPVCLDFPDELLEEPVIRLEKNSYSAGDTLRANCSSPPSSPPANVTWYLNGEEEEASSLQHHGNTSDTVTTASLTVELSAVRFPGGKLRLRCVADLFSISRTVRELWLDEDRPRLASVLGNKNSAGQYLVGGAPSFTCLLQMALMAAVIHFR